MAMQPGGFARHVEAHWDEPERREAAKQLLRTDGFAVLRQFITPETLAFTRQRLAMIEHDLPMDFRPVPLRKYCHNEPFFQILHRVITPVLQAVIPQPVKPSYCMLGVYQAGADLFRHVDREQCAWNVSIAFDSDPLVGGLDDSWPIFIERDGVAHCLRAALGDAVIYPGTEYPHWRETLPARFSRYALCFFHYVDAGFAGSLR